MSLLVTECFTHCSYVLLLHRMACEGPTAAGPAHSLLLDLPDPCLLTVLQCCADEIVSLFSAARAHSRLHQAAVLALQDATVSVSEEQVEGLLLYLDKHGKQMDSIDLDGEVEWGGCQDHSYVTVTLRQLPPQLQPSSLCLSWFCLQLQAGGGFQGVLGPAARLAALKKLQQKYCNLPHCGEIKFGDGEGLAAVLPLLPAGLEHLSIVSVRVLTEWYEPRLDDNACFPTGVLQQLQQLTYLELAALQLKGPDAASPALQPLQYLTRLVDLRLDGHQMGLNTATGCSITANMLLGARSLVRLELSYCSVEPGVLAGKTQLQHLDIDCTWHGGPAGVAEMLSCLQDLQQLTHLGLQDGYTANQWTAVPAAAFSALTAGSKLQELDISFCNLPVGVWEHVLSLIHISEPTRQP